MISWRHIDVFSVVRLYFRARQQREAPPSLSGRDPDMPAAPSRVPPSGYWEQLCWLMRGIPMLGLLCLERRVLGVGGFDRVPVVGGDPARVLCWDRVARAPSTAQIARDLGMHPEEVRTLLAAALQIIAENLGRLRAAERQEIS